jgi:GH18 family chitinase
VSTNSQLVNAWIFLNEDEPSGTNYNSPNSCYQTLIQNNVYQSMDILSICFLTTLPTSAQTVPQGDGSSYTLSTGNPPPSHPGGLTNQDYMLYVVRDARKNNPNIKITVTLVYGPASSDPNSNGRAIADIFSNPNYTPQQNAANFAANLVTFLKTYELDGFDIDWEYALSDVTTQQQFSLLINAIGAQFKQQTDKHYYLTLSPAVADNLDATAINNNVDFINLQLYSGFTTPGEFTAIGVNPKLFAYGAKFESNFQTASGAYQDNQQNYQYPIFTCWRLNSDNYQFEQQQQQELYRLVFPIVAAKSQAS